jgi:hypothetical protein
MKSRCIQTCRTAPLELFPGFKPKGAGLCLQGLKSANDFYGHFYHSMEKYSHESEYFLY